MFDNLVIQFGALVGLSALIAVLINILKYTNLVKEGDGQKWSAGFNLIALVTLFSLKIFNLEFNIEGLDSQLAEFASVMVMVLGYVVQLIGSKFTHELVLKDLPIIGKVHS